MALLKVRKEEFDLDIAVIHIAGDDALADLVRKISQQIAVQGGFWIRHQERGLSGSAHSLRWIPARGCEVTATFDGDIPADIATIAVADA